MGKIIRGALLAALVVMASGCARLQPLLKSFKKAPAEAGQSAALTNAPVLVEEVAAPSMVPAASVASPVASGSDLVASRSPYRIRCGDPVIIYLRGIMPKDEMIEEIVDERGLVTLPYIDDVAAEGKTGSELEREIQKTYIRREIYRTVSVNVVLPSMSFFVQGEVRQPQRYPLVTGLTIMQAIAASGGYTEFADPKRVTLTRGRDVRTINMRTVERNPDQDISVESGDVIRIPRSMF